MVHIFSNVKNRVWAISNLKSYTNLLKIMNKCVIIYILFKINYQQKNGLITAKPGSCWNQLPLINCGELSKFTNQTSTKSGIGRDIQANFKEL